MLQGAAFAPLTVVVGPAGSGKTTLLAEGFAHSKRPIAWFAADETGSGAEFWLGIVAALEPVCPGCATRAPEALRSGATLEEAVAELLDDLHAANNNPTVLLVDDIHLVDSDDDVAASLELFVQHLPTWLRVVLASRTEPKLPLDRLRARGQLIEVRFPELKFSAHEAREMLLQRTVLLSDAQLDSVIERADGWAGTLELAVAAARTTEAHAQVEDFEAEYERLLRNYVLHEVLAGESPDSLVALHDLSLVDLVCTSLAHALTGRADAARLLETMEARCLVTRLGPSDWFTMHPLVLSVLRADLATASPDRAPRLHLAAAGWYENEGDVRPALEHLLLADEPRRALRLLAANHTRLYDRGNEATIRDTIAAIPSSVAMDDVEAIIELGWCQFLVDRHSFSETVSHLAWRAEQSGLDEIATARVILLQSIDATLAGDWRAGAPLARSSQQAFGDHSWRDPIVRFSWNMIAREIALAERWDDASDEVSAIEAGLTRDPERRLAFEGTRALGHALAGRPVDSLRVSAGAKRTSVVSDMMILSSELALAEAVAHRELADRVRAVDELGALFGRQTEPMLYVRALAGLELAQLRLDEGDPTAAREVFDAVATLVEVERLGAGLRLALARVGAVVALSSRRLDEARHWSEQVEDPFWSGVSAARVHLAGGDRQAARSALASAEARSPRHEVVLGLLQAQASGSGEEAEALTAAAVECAVRNSMLQTVASAGPDVVAMVEPVAWDAPKSWMDRLRRAAGRSEVPVADLAGIFEGLTDRERDVLRFLPSRLTVREIADELYISINTLKFHLRVIYRKLGVNSRAETVEIVRGLLNR